MGTVKNITKRIGRELAFTAAILVIAPYALYRATRQQFADGDYVMTGFCVLTFVSFAFAIYSIVRGI